MHVAVVTQQQNELLNRENCQLRNENEKLKQQIEELQQARLQQTFLPSSSSAQTDDILEECLLFPQKVSRLRYLRVDYAACAKPRPGSVEYIALQISGQWETIAQELGEARGLALYSNISSILQTLPEQDVVFKPYHVYVATIFDMAWQLTGSAEQRKPTIISTAPKEEIQKLSCRLINYMGKLLSDKTKHATYNVWFCKHEVFGIMCMLCVWLVL